MTDLRNIIRETVLKVARGNHPRHAVKEMLQRLREDTDVEVSDDESGGDAAEMLDDLTVGMEGPDPTIGAGGDPPQGEAEDEPLKVSVPQDPADEEPGAAGAGVKSAPTDGTENDFAIESWRKGARAILDRHLKEEEDDDSDKDDDSDDSSDDDSDKGDDKKGDDKKGDDKKGDDKKDEARRRRIRARKRIKEEGDKDDMPDFIKKKMKGGDDDDSDDKKKDEARRRKVSLKEQDGSYQIGVPVTFAPTDGRTGGPATVGHKFFHGQGYTYMLEVEGVGTMLAEEDEVQDAPGTPEGQKAVT